MTSEEFKSRQSIGDVEDGSSIGTESQLTVNKENEAISVNERACVFDLN